jgi:hypothetical protein
MIRFYGVFLAIAALPVIAGCQETGPETHPVSGKVTIGGQPAEGLQVTFTPLESGKEAASGNIGPGGEYTLYTGVDGKEGAPPGKYKVTLSDPGDSSYMETGTDPTTIETGRVPKEYRNVTTTPKEVEVTAGENTINIDI